MTSAHSVDQTDIQSRHLHYSSSDSDCDHQTNRDNVATATGSRKSPSKILTGRGGSQTSRSPATGSKRNGRVSSRSPGEDNKRKKSTRSPGGSASKRMKQEFQEETGVMSNIAMDKRVSTFVGRDFDDEEEANVTISDYRQYLRHVLQRKTLVDRKLKNIQRQQGTEVKIEKLALLEKEMMVATRKIVAKWHRKGKWVFYPTSKVCKTQKKSMDSAGVTHKSEFAADITRDFLKYDWPDMENWDIKKLWSGGLKVFQLGKQAMMALKDARNMCTQRVVATVDQFLVIPLDNKTITETKKIKLRALRRFAMGGRKDKNSLKACLPLLAAFCLQKERESTTDYRPASNWTIEKKMTITKICFLRLQERHWRSA